jgi:uncharacterized phage protein (TIGR01671 family)
MNRPIKFRAWNHRYKKMFEVTHLDMSSSEVMTGYVDFEDNEGDIWDATFDGKDHTLMQYTGLKDKNGKEIYEGDIIQYELSTVKNRVFTATVTWQYFGFELEEKGGGGFQMMHGIPYTIIGNIYENGDLLK